MATTTPVMGLRKPVGTDNVNVVTDIGDNMDKIDALPQGKIGYAQVSANQTGITASVDLTGLSVTVTVAAGRRIRITGQVPANNVIASVSNVLYIYEGATLVQQCWMLQSPTPSTEQTMTVCAILTPSAGSHTYKLKLTNTSGTTTMLASASSLAYILVEDIGV